MFVPRTEKLSGHVASEWHYKWKIFNNASKQPTFWHGAEPPWWFESFPAKPQMTPPWWSCRWNAANEIMLIAVKNNRTRMSLATLWRFNIISQRWKNLNGLLCTKHRSGCCNDTWVQSRRASNIKPALGPLEGQSQPIKKVPFSFSGSFKNHKGWWCNPYPLFKWSLSQAIRTMLKIVPGIASSFHFRNILST